MNAYNPMLEYQRKQLLAQQEMIQQQLAQLGQPTLSQTHYTPNPAPPNPQYFVREVASFDEVKRVPPEPCAIYIFPDTATGKIYMKRLNSDTGRSEYYSYVLENDGDTQSADPMKQMNERLERIEKMIGGINVQSVSENATNTAVREKSARRSAAANATENAAAKSADVSTGSADDERQK